MALCCPFLSLDDFLMAAPTFFYALCVAFK